MTVYRFAALVNAPGATRDRRVEQGRFVANEIAHTISEGHEDAITHQSATSVGGDMVSIVVRFWADSDVEAARLARTVMHMPTLGGTIRSYEFESLRAGGTNIATDAHWCCESCETDGVGNGPAVCPHCGHDTVNTFLPVT